MEAMPVFGDPFLPYELSSIDDLWNGQTMQKSESPSPSSSPGKTRRMAPELRRQILLERATLFFADHGMSAPTRALAEACGVAQRLLYRYFPSKAGLLGEIYEQAILAPFKSIWLIRLADRSVEIEQRIGAFYDDYYQTVLSRRWIRLFLFGGLDGGNMAPDYIDQIIKQLIEVVVCEAAHSRDVALPRTQALRHELGWVLHGAVSHLAIRQHVYGASQSVPVADIVAIQIASFLQGLPAAAAIARAQETIEVPKLDVTLKSSVYD
jgi:AcrR family transcriptional regulator